MSEPVVSVVIPTRNRCHLLKETVSSVSRQTILDWELIVVDDASADDTWSWLRGLKDPRLRPVRLERHSERSEARNVGLDAAKGRFVLFLDDDDLLAEGALRAHLGSLEPYPAAIASIGGYFLLDPTGSRRPVRIVRRGTVRRIWHDVLFGWMAISGQCLFRTQCIRAVNGWNRAYNIAEDHELWMRLGRLGAVVLMPDIVVTYRVHEGQWRPANLDQIMSEIREQAVGKVDSAERTQSERILQARADARVAYEHYKRGETGKALRFYAKAAFSVPNLLLSPLTRPLILRPAVGCLLGSTTIRLGRLAFSWFQRFSKIGPRAN